MPAGKAQQISGLATPFLESPVVQDRAFLWLESFRSLIRAEEKVRAMPANITLTR